MAHERQHRMERLLDRQDIVDCMSRMSRGADRLDKDLFLSAFHEDAIISTGPFVGGPEGLWQWSLELQQTAYSATAHYLLNHSFDFDGDTAHVETYFIFVGCAGEETNLVAGGRYIDRFERRDGAWSIVMRNNFVEWSSAVPAAANPLGEIPDLHLNGLPSRGKDDPSYDRPLVNRRLPSGVSRG